MKTFVMTLLMMTAFMGFSQKNSIYHKKNKEKLANHLKKMNELMSGKCKLTHKKKRIVAEFFMNGEKIREDILYVEAMDPERISYSHEEHAVIARCKKDLTGRMSKFSEGCVQRKIFSTGSIRPYHRINFIVKDTDMSEVEEFEKYLRELIKDAQLMDHQY